MIVHSPKPETREHDTGMARGSGHITAQRTLFAGPSDAAPAELYCTCTRGVMVPGRDSVILDGHATASTNTFFGRFPASHWQRWTSIRTVDLEAIVSGSGLVRVMASDSEGDPRTVATHRAEDAHSAPVRLTVPVDKFVDGGAMWLELQTTTAGMTVERVRWSVGAGSRSRRPTAVVICTYNRADDCLSTLQTLASDPDVLAELSVVYVVDQGTDTVESRSGFPAVQEALGDTLRYIRQPNLGGAGGFTRGIYEAVRNETVDRVNLLLMDDDIRLEPETVLRLRALADRADQPIIVGGQMLNLLHPHRLHVGAEGAELSVLRPGVPAEHALVDADLTEKQQDVRVEGTYNGWWACLIPSEIVQAVGYPLPMFFQWDDIEYGFRAGEAGFPTVTLPGAGVWHADFSWKDWDDWSRYFNFRNSLITSALHSDFDRRRIIDHLATQLINYLVSMRYGLAAVMIRAVEDFLRGPDVLADGGADTVAVVRKLWGEYQDSASHPAHAVHGLPVAGRPKATPAGKPSMPRAVLAKRILWQLLRKSSDTVAVSSADAHWWHVSLFETAVVTDASQEGVRVRRFDRAVMVDLARRGGVVLVRLLREGERVRDQYRAALPELTDRDIWTRLFDTK